MMRSLTLLRYTTVAGRLLSESCTDTWLLPVF